jgi:hypothetical protein
MCYSPSDEVGLLLFGTKTTNNQLHDDPKNADFFLNIDYKCRIEKASVDLVKAIRAIKVEDAPSDCVCLECMRGVCHTHHLELDVVASDTGQNVLQDVVFGRCMPCSVWPVRALKVYIYIYICNGLNAGLEALMVGTDELLREFGKRKVEKKIILITMGMASCA